MKSGLWVVGLLLGLASAAGAEDAALLLGNERYDTLPRVPGAAAMVLGTASLQSHGFTVAAIQNGDADSASQTIEQFLQSLEGAGRVLVGLSGHFVTDGDRTWFLTADAPEAGLFGMGATAISVDSLLRIMATAPGNAILLLGSDGAESEARDAWLAEGIGNLSIPQGVTVIRAPAPLISVFLRQDLARPGADVVAAARLRAGMSVEGFVPASLVFVPEAAPDAPEGPAVTDTLAEDALWDGAKALDTLDAYRNYLARYPQGRHASEAESAIASIVAEPDRAARLAEESLDLTRDQRRAVQQDLTTLGFDTRGVDGIFGAGSRGAIRAWQDQAGFPANGYLTPEQISRLDAGAQVRIAEQAAEAERQHQQQLRMDQSYWAVTGARGDEAGYRAYLSRYPEGVYASVARDSLSAIESARRSEAEAADRLAWRTASQVDTIESYKSYLTTYSDGLFAATARSRVRTMEQAEEELTDRNDWQDAAAVGTLEAYQAYLAAHPRGIFKADAEAQIAALTPAEPDPNAELQAAEDALNLDAGTRTTIEAKLRQLGVDPGRVDGVFDNHTRRAIRRYQDARGLTVTGYLDQLTLLRLLADVISINR